MKCFEGYSIKQIKEMSLEELQILHQKLSKEQQEIWLREELIKQYEINTPNNCSIVS